MPKLTGSDIVAIVLLVGAFTLRALGINSLTEYIIIGIASLYGLRRAQVHIKPPRGGHC